MSTNVKTDYSANISSIIKWAIAIILPLVIYAIPSNELYTQQIKLFLVISVFAILCIAFERLDFMLIAIMLPLAYFGLGIVPPEVAMKPWSTTMPYMCFGAFLLANVLDEVGLLKRIAYWCIVKSGGSYQGIVWGTFFAATILTLLTFGNAYVIMAALCYGICKALGLKCSRESAVIMLAGTVGAMTTRMFIYSPVMLSLLISGGKEVDPSFNITWSELLIDNLPCALFCVGFIYILTKFYKPSQEFNGKAYFAAEYQRLGKMSMNEKKSLIVVMALMIFLLSGSIHNIALDWGFIILPWVFYLPGFQVGSKQSIKNVDYTMVFFIVACLSIGTVSTALGIGKIVSTMMIPILEPLNAVAVLSIIFLLGVVLNFLLTPLAIMAAFAAPIAQIAVDLGINAQGALYALFHSIDQLLLPYEFVPYLIFFSFGMIPMKEFMKIMGLKMVLFFVFLLVVLIPYWMLLGVI